MALDTLPTPSYPAPHPGFWGRVHVVVRVAVALLACLVIVGSAAMIGKLIIDPNGSEEFTVGRRPAINYQAFENEERAFPDNAYADVVGVVGEGSLLVFEHLVKERGSTTHREFL